MKIDKEQLENFNKLKHIYLDFLVSEYKIPNEQHSKLLHSIFIDSTQEANTDDYSVVRDIMEYNSPIFFKAFYGAPMASEENYSRACLHKFYKEVDYTIDYLIQEFSDE